METPQTKMHPTHRKHFIANTCLSLLLMVTGPFLGECFRQSHDLQHINWVGDFLTLAGLFLGFAGTIWFMFVLKCPQCSKLIFSGEHSYELTVSGEYWYPKSKIFYCRRCNVNWDSGIEVVGGGD